MTDLTVASVTQSNWFGLFEPEQQRAITLAFELLEREQQAQTQFSDYSFIIFPIAKAYEGFLKLFLYEMGLISKEVYIGRHFRIGRALNPDISINQRDQWWLYDDVVRLCGEEIARKLWQAWLSCRNHVFHYFPDAQNELTLTQVEKKMRLLVEVFESAWKCDLKRRD